MRERHKLGLWTGVGLVAANMIGAGVFLSAGFMAQDLRPGTILLAWIVGAVLALAGSFAYAEIARLIPRSGGEYRYLSELMHPALGYLAGWASMLVGFSGPIAIDALAAGAFLQRLVPSIDGRITAVTLIVILTVLHCSSKSVSKVGQNALVAVKCLLILAFIAMGLGLGSWQWPSWQPSTTHESSLAPFMASLFFIAFAFSGWNATAYVAEEFERPTRDVPRAMLIGCAAVAVVYLVVNWVFVANLTPTEGKVVFAYETERITLGHAIAENLIGQWGAQAISGLMFVTFVSAASAMTFVGPRVYAAMAQDGMLPQILRAKSGRPPAASVLLQSALALAILMTQPLRRIVHDVGAIVTLFSALTVLSLYKARFWDRRRVSASALAAAGIYVALAAWLLYFGFAAKTQLLVWIGAAAACALIAYVVTTRSRQRATRPSQSSSTE